MLSASLQMTPCCPEPKHKKTRPGRPALKIPLPPSPWGPAAHDLDVLVSDAIKAQPTLTPRRNQPEFLMRTMAADPAPPPPSPAEGTDMNARSPAFPSPRGSSESKRVVFSERWTDDDGGSGRTSIDSDRSSTQLSAKGRVM